MSQRSRPLIAAVFIAACSLTLSSWRPQTTAAAQAQTVTLTIIGTNDLHGGIIERDGRGGLALLGGYVANVRAVRAKDNGAVLMVDGGDMFQGTLESNLSEGASVVSAYNALGYTAVTVGNHEFDFGPAGPSATPRSPADDPRGALKARAAEARFPFLAANLIDTATNAPVTWPNVRPSTMVKAAGVNVGIIGVMTATGLAQTIAANVRDLRLAPIAATIEAEAAALRKSGATVVIVAAHSGSSCTRFDNPADLTACDADGEIMRVARALPAGAVDAIVAGHTHAPVGHQVAGIPISEAYSGGRSFGRIDLVVDRTAGRVVRSQSFAPRDLCARVEPGTATCAANGVQATYEGAPVAADANVAATLVPAVQQASALKSRAVGIDLETPIRRANVNGESPLGNLFVDAFLAATPGADVALNNTSGGLRADLPAGPLTYGRVFEVLPFDNLLVTLRITGADLRKVVAAQLQQRRGLSGLAGVRVRATCTGGALNVVMLRPSGAPIRDDEPIVLVTSDFIALGGDGLLAPIAPPQGFAFAPDGPLGREIAVESLRRRGGRLNESQLVDAGNPRWVYPGQQPVACGGE